MPRALPDALLEGLAWDAEERRCDTISDLFAYSARVASAVGAMMTVLMGVRDPDALARACDLGVAMQLTNIARDVGEDAREGRLYLPLEWLDEMGVDQDAFISNPKPTEEIRLLTKRLIMEARRLYFRSEPGLSALPLGCRPGIWAARLIYAGIGQEVARIHSAASVVMPQSAGLYAPPLPEVKFLVDAAAHARPHSRSVALLDTLASLEAQRRGTA